MVEALVVVPTVIVKMVDMEEAGEEVVAVIIDKMVINFKIINFSENLILADFYFFFPYAKILNENDVSLIKKIVKGDNKLRTIKSKA